MEGFKSKTFFERAVSYSSKEFIRGFLLGQLALLFTIIVLCRLLFFRSVPIDNRIRFTPAARRMVSPSLGIKADSSRIATKETCIWFNSLMGKFIFEPLRTQLSRTETKLLLSEILNDQGPISISVLQVSNNDPLLTWVESSEKGARRGGGNRYRTHFEWIDAASFEMVTTIHPFRRVTSQILAVLPCTFSATIHNLSFTADLWIPHEDDQKATLTIEPEDFVFELELHSKLGGRVKLEDIPKITTLLQGKIRQFIANLIVSPNSIKLDLSGIRRHLDDAFSSAMKEYGLNESKLHPHYD